MLDYPGVIIPVGAVDKLMDQKDESYAPVGPKDQENHDMSQTTQNFGTELLYLFNWWEETLMMSTCSLVPASLIK
ncbi:hypothetical protein LTR10_013031 [Elasticomyces elasticus]|uniref:Uncharacterized protein n=1 Tax=Exophiala sideris TaxID=1016849 RepID=A0ABR0JAI6_9EURO|nr:hypothetical protein LTR10_013031 [Elasticomyces elasticus]KAK5030407.1 hypothetical protein LTS07_005191 [Exophiala sideris]KAK5038460.1 hypothetical protein LTR13_004207 [Exophiala sideris]KAK5060343.1 hypothetical protein LTR69_005660 [Exophiala sideris]KAK5183253.1 hypothetical protein LTR44_004254 [Eurotiomycetes sp. CCFEE 6388]